MKKALKSLMFTLCFVLLIVCRPNIASAEITEQDDLKVKLQLEKVDNSENEIKAIVKITNVGIRPIEEINIKSIIPKGMKIKEENTLSYKIEKLDAGKSNTYEFYAEIEDNEILQPDTDDNTNTDGNTNNNDDNKVDSGSSTEGSDDTDKPSNNVETGDSNTILLSVLAITGCLSIIILLSKTDRKNSEKFLSIFICISLVAPMFGNLMVIQADEIEKRDISVKEIIEIGNGTYEIETIVSYKVKSNVVKPSENVITRGEWISKLVNETNLKDEQELTIDDFEYPFDDIEGHKYEEDIIFADIYSILDIKEGLFKPDEPASREFVAYTSVKALGFAGTQDITCDDSSQITYLKEVETAVSMKIMNLENNKFYPLRLVTESEVKYALEGISGILSSSEIDENYDNTFEYKEGVVELQDDISYEVNQSTLTLELNDQTKNLKKNDIFVLPTQTPYKVVDVKIEGNNVIIETVEPEIEETLEYIDVQGNENLDATKFIPAEGIEIVQDNNGETRGINIDQEGNITVPGTLNLKINKKINDNVKVAGSLAFGMPKVSYKADVNVKGLNVDINNVFLKIKPDLKFKGGISASTDGFAGVDGYFEIGKVPVAGIPGVGVYVEIGGFYSVDGTIDLIYTYKGDLGIQVLNNKPRYIVAGKTDANIEAAATVKFGPKVKGLLEVCSTWDLIDFSAAAGGAGKASSTNITRCIDFTGYGFLDLTAFDECLIKKWKGWNYTWSIFNADNSPIKLKYHLENFNKVPECTYNKATIKGTVAKAGNREQSIKNALIQVYNTSNNKVIAEAYSDSNGQYEIKKLNSGNYRIKISKDGYITFETRETLSGNEVKYIETLLMVGQGVDGEEGIAGGKITNSLTGEGIANVSIKIRRGWNNTVENVIKTTSTDESGMYEVKLPLGNYTVEMSKNGYTSKSYNIYVASGKSLNQNNTLVPSSCEVESGDLRVVLTWGESPADLDSHLLGPTADGSDYFHIYYGDKKYSKNGEKYADLDLDDTDSYGPETTTIYNMNSTGKYSFYVHDYTNRKDNFSTQMSNSGAKVEVYKGDTLIKTYHIPTNRVGTYWHVFDYDAESNSIVPVNEFVEEIEYKNNRTNLYTKPIWETIEKTAS